MWRPATRQITGTNDGVSPIPLGQRRRFGPAPAEESLPPQLAQPSPSAYPRPQPESPGKRGREESSANDTKGKFLTIGTATQRPVRRLAAYASLFFFFFL
ncbi:hypothetical protein GGX14DRAFT_354724 [Mycena pura]|uniref:Uncharacterized protein n=1 Tax=Mycena pura TaxID=153505 RepID=A0AAD6VTX7_9AGAR|nr:hypothetical protein GGX14DRAFT_354724 [Mycena pura]